MKLNNLETIRFDEEKNSCRKMNANNVLVLIGSLVFIWLVFAAQTSNAQYFSVSDGGTVGRIGRRSDPSTLKKILSHRVNDKRVNDLGKLSLSDDEEQGKILHHSNEANKEDIDRYYREYLLRLLVNEYLNN